MGRSGRLRGLRTLARRLIAAGLGIAVWSFAVYAMGQSDSNGSVAGATAPPPSAEEIQRLQRQLDELRERLAATSNCPTAADAATPNDGSAALMPEESHWIDGICDRCKEQLSWQKGPCRIVPYGWLEGQMMAASDDVTGHTTVVYVNEGSTLGRLPELNIHGQTSALGFNFYGPDIGSFHSGGRIYMNFAGEQPLINEITPFLINAYGELRNEECRILFGQYYALVSPLDPTMINFGLNMYGGNICSYRGQFRFEHYFRPGENAVFTTQVAISQPFVTDFAPPAEEQEAGGSDNGLPNLEGRALLALGPMVEGLDRRSFEFGVSGMIGQSRIVKNDDKHTPNEAMVGCDVQLSAPWIGMKGELFYGYGLGSYGGGIGQSFNPTTSRPIHDAGGWIELWAKPFSPQVMIAAGYGIDHPLFEDMLPTSRTVRTRNECYYATLFWNITERFDVGLEVDYRATDYMNLPTFDLPGMRLIEDNYAMVYWFRTRLTF